jgi:hypothetical protein
LFKNFDFKTVILLEYASSGSVPAGVLPWSLANNKAELFENSEFPTFISKDKIALVN